MWETDRMTETLGNGTKENLQIVAVYDDEEQPRPVRQGISRSSVVEVNDWREVNGE